MGEDHDKIIRLEADVENLNEKVDGLGRDRRFVVIAVLSLIGKSIMEYLKGGQ